MELVKIDLSKIEFVKTSDTNEFRTHPDIKIGHPYLAKVHGNWYVAIFQKVWFGLTADIGASWIQLSYRVRGKWTPGFEELYEIKEKDVT